MISHLKKINSLEENPVKKIVSYSVCASFIFGTMHLEQTINLDFMSSRCGGNC